MARRADGKKNPGIMTLPPDVVTVDASMDASGFPVSRACAPHPRPGFPIQTVSWGESLSWVFLSVFPSADRAQDL